MAFRIWASYFNTPCYDDVGSPRVFSLHFVVSEDFSYGMSSLSWVVLSFSVFHGECVLLVLATWSSGKRQQKSFIASPFLTQQGVCKCNRHTKWEVFLQFGKKGWRKRGEKDFLSSSRNRVSHKTGMVYWDRFLLNFQARGQQVEDHVSQWGKPAVRHSFQVVWKGVVVRASPSKCKLHFFTWLGTLLKSSGVRQCPTWEEAGREDST